MAVTWEGHEILVQEIQCLRMRRKTTRKGIPLKYNIKPSQNLAALRFLLGPCIYETCRKLMKTDDEIHEESAIFSSNLPKEAVSTKNNIFLKCNM